MSYGPSVQRSGCAGDRMLRGQRVTESFHGLLFLAIRPPFNMPSVAGSLPLALLLFLPVSVGGTGILNHLIGDRPCFAQVVQRIKDRSERIKKESFTLAFVS